MNLFTLKIPQIYIIENKISESIYIGKTVGSLARRWREHKCNAITRNSTNVIHLAMRKYGVDNFSIKTVAFYEDDRELREAEIFWISEMRHYLGRKKVYNSTDGGDGSVGYIVSESTKQKLRKVNLGKKQSVETIEKKRVSNSGFRHSEDTKKKLSEDKIGVKNPMFGKKLSKESIEKRTSAQLGRLNTDETKIKISEKRKGQRLSDETKRKLSEIRMGRTWKVINGKRTFFDIEGNEIPPRINHPLVALPSP